MNINNVWKISKGYFKMRDEKETFLCIMLIFYLESYINLVIIFSKLLKYVNKIGAFEKENLKLEGD